MRACVFSGSTNGGSTDHVDSLFQDYVTYRQFLLCYIEHNYVYVFLCFGNNVGPWATINDEAIWFDFIDLIDSLSSGQSAGAVLPCQSGKYNTTYMYSYKYNTTYTLNTTQHTQYKYNSIYTTQHDMWRPESMYDRISSYDCFNRPNLLWRSLVGHCTGKWNMSSIWSYYGLCSNLNQSSLTMPCYWTVAQIATTMYSVHIIYATSIDCRIYWC